MRKIHSTVLFIILLLFSGMIYAENYNLTKSVFRVNTFNSTKTDIVFKLPQFNMENVSNEKGAFTKLNFGETEMTVKEGLPELPIFTVNIAVPVNSIPFIQNESVTASQTINNIRLYPSQGDQDASKAFCYNDRVYETDTSYPAQKYSVSQVQVIRDYAFITVQINPLQYNAQQRSLTVNKEIRITVNHASADSKYQITDQLSSAFEPLYKAQFANYEQIRSDYPVYQKPSLLILYPTNTTAAYLSELNKLVNWKKQKGFNVTVATGTDIGTTTTSIKNYIQNAYDTWANKPEYIMLIGDASAGSGYQIPTYNIAYGSFSSYGGAGDYQYTFLKGDDFYGDAMIGRLSIASVTDFQVMVSKIMQYERAVTSEGTGWMNENLLVGDTAPSGYSCVVMNKYVKGLKEEYDPAHNYTELYGDSPSPASMQTKISSGVLTFNYRGYIGMSGFAETQVNGLTNINKLCNAVLITCSTGGFSSSSMIEWITRAGTATEPKGAITAVGMSTSGTHTPYNNSLMGGVFHALYKSDITTMGGAMLYAKHYIHHVYGQSESDAAKTFAQWLNLMGDPTVNIYRTAAKTFTITVPTTVPVGTNYITVVVKDNQGNPVKNAWVSLTQTYVSLGFKLTDDTGKAVLPIDPEFTGSLHLAVSHPNFISKLMAIQPESNTSVGLNAFSITDTPNGNNNQQINPGEAIRLSTNIKNYTSSTVSNLTLKLRTTNPYITITDSTASIASISAGATNSLTNEFAFNISGTYQNNFPLQFELVITSGNNTWRSMILTEVKAADLDVLTLPGSTTHAQINQNVSTNLSFTVKNNGSITASGINAVFVSKSIFLDVSDSLAYFGDIANGGTANNQSNTFTVSALTGAFPGSILKGEIRFYNSNGYVEKEEVLIQVGNINSYDPIPPDAYGYVIYDNTDTGYSDAPVYNWVEVSTTGTALDLADTGENNDKVTTINLPFNFKMYGETYSQASVCSNGWLSLGVTEQANFRNLPMPGPLVPRPMIAPYWNDLKKSGANSGVYTWYNSSEQYFVIQWNQMVTLSNNIPVTFQAILYNPAVYNTPMGDGPIKFQYKTFHPGSQGTETDPNNFISCGIQDHTALTGITYTYNNQYTPGAATLGSNSALYITVPVVSSQEAYIVLNNATVNTTGTNSINYNSASPISVSINNIGNQPASNLSLRLRSFSPYITLTDSLESVSLIQASQSVTLNNAFAIRAASDAPDGINAAMRLEISDNQGHTWNSNLIIQIKAPSITFGALTIDDQQGNNNGRLDAGENAVITIPVHNPGHLATEAGLIHYVSTNPLVTVANSDVNIPVIPAGGTWLLTLNVSVSPQLTAGYTSLGLLAQAGTLSLQQNFQISVGMVIESFETGNFNAYPWTFSEAPWTISNVNPFEGSYCAKSGVIGNNTTTYMSVSVISGIAGNVSFAYKVSSELNYDKLKFYIDDVEKQVWSGSIDWTEISYPVTAGNHTYKWAFVKDNTVIGGEDCTWVDKIVFPSAGNATPLNAPLAYTNTDMLFFNMTPETKILKLVNFGNQPLTGQITVPTGFSLNNAGTASLNYNIPAYSHQNFTLIYNPLAPVSYNGQITISTNDTLHPQFVINIIAGINGKHFNPIWAGNAIQPMTFNFTTSVINNLPLQFGDEIAVFDGLNCVGSIQILAINPSGYSVISSLDNPATPDIDGFISGNSYQFKLWNSITQTEYSGAQVYADLISGNTQFTANSTASFHLHVHQVMTQNVTLNSGWNIVSFNVITNQPDVATVFSPLVNNNQLIKVQNEGGYAYEYLSILNQWINQINNIESTEAYYVKVNNNTNLSILGYQTPVPLTIPLNTGWNLISFPYHIQHQAMPLLTDLISDNTLVKIMNESGQAIEQLPIIGWVNELQNLAPGKGYAIKVSRNTSLTYPAEANNNSQIALRSDNTNHKKLTQNSNNSSRNDHFQKVWTGNGYKHFNLYILANDYLNSQLTAGDEIAVFDGSLCVGTHTVGEAEPYFSIICSMNDNTDNPNGFTPGNAYSLKIFRDQTDYETIDFVRMSGDDTFVPGGTTLLEINNMLSANDLLTPKVTAIQSIYPNPFNPETTIQYSLHKADVVEIEIYNIKGQKVKTLIHDKQNAGNYQITWQGKDNNGKSVASGMYFCRLKTTSKLLTRKMMLIK